MKKLFLVLMLGLVVSMSGVSAMDSRLSNLETECSQSEIDMFRKCYHNREKWCDMNKDGKWNLIDVGRYARECHNPETPTEPSEQKTFKRGSSLRVVTLPDCSKTYLTKAHAFQLKEGVLLKWTPNYVGWNLWENKRIMVEDRVGVNIKDLNLKCEK